MKALTQEQINAIRHPLELPIYFVLVILNTLIFCFIIGALLLIPYGQILQYIKQGNLYTGAVLIVVGSYIGYGVMFSNTRIQAVAIGEQQFPDLYALMRTYAEQLGIRRMPQLYIRQENGTLNAFAAYYRGRNYVSLNTEIFEVYYLEHHDMDAVGFVLAHELAHVRLHHTRFWYNVSIFFIRMIPFIGPLLSRANEYSCDALARTICPNGKHGIFLLLVGRHLFPYVDVDVYLEQARKTRGWFEFFINAGSSHPVNTRRIRALYGDNRGKLIF